MNRGTQGSQSSSQRGKGGGGKPQSSNTGRFTYVSGQTTTTTTSNTTTSSGKNRAKDQPFGSEYSRYVVHSQKAPFDVYIGRPNPKVKVAASDCVWGNPFKIGDDGDREDVISKYRTWLETTPEGQLVRDKARKELKGKVLACWCSPLHCHGHVLAEVANSPEEKTENKTESVSLQKANTPANVAPKLNNYSILMEGVVLIRKAFSLVDQQTLCTWMARYGDGEIEGVGSFWVKRSQAEITREHGYADPIPEHSDPTSGILNLRTKARMNVPFDKSPIEVWDLCSPLLDNASALCPCIPKLNPTVWRLNYYTTKGQIGWHSDRHPFVDANLQHTVKEPVISVTLGNSGNFDYRTGPGESDFVSLKLDSGDVLIFGGPARMVVHRITKIFPNTKPSSLNLGAKYNNGRFNFAFYDN